MNDLPDEKACIGCEFFSFSIIHNDSCCHNKTVMRLSNAPRGYYPWCLSALKYCTGKKAAPVSKKHWNKEILRKRYVKIKESAQLQGFTGWELEKPYLDRLSHETKSPRILHMLSRAYTLGKLKGISEISEQEVPKKHLDLHIARIKDDAKSRGLTDDQLDDNCIKLLSRTNSARISRMIQLAYTLGRMKGVSEIDEGFTPIVLD